MKYLLFPQLYFATQSNVSKIAALLASCMILLAAADCCLSNSCLSSEFIVSAAEAKRSLVLALSSFLLTLDDLVAIVFGVLDVRMVPGVCREYTSWSNILLGVCII